MMNDLISRSALIEEIERQKLSLDKDSEWSYNMTLNIVDIFSELINKQPTVEAKPVVHGEWIKGDCGEWQCSVCEEENCYAYCESIKKFTDLYCPNCGADMRGGKNE